MCGGNKSTLHHRIEVCPRRGCGSCSCRVRPHVAFCNRIQLVMQLDQAHQRTGRSVVESLPAIARRNHQVSHVLAHRLGLPTSPQSAPRYADAGRRWRRSCRRESLHSLFVPVDEGVVSGNARIGSPEVFGDVPGNGSGSNGCGRINRPAGGLGHSLA